MRKPVLNITSIIAIIFLISCLVSCSGVEIQFQPNSAMVKKPKKILIGHFENRMPEYNPFIIKDFRDALKFEFLKLGYNAELISSNSSRKGDNFTCADKIEYANAKEQQKIKANPAEPDKEAINLCCEKYKAGMFIRGSVSILEAGELTDSKASTFISLMIYNRYGEKIGEAHYSGSGQMEHIKSIKAIAKDFAAQINSELHKTQQDDNKGIFSKIMNFLVD